MPKRQLYQEDSDNLSNLTMRVLRERWAQIWGREPHARIGRTMLIKSLEYRQSELEAKGLNPEQQKRLKQLVASYKRNPRCFDENLVGIKPGTRIIKIWREKRHSVLVLENGFEYEGKFFSSLSEVASTIAGTRWNGWAFFGLKKKGGAE